MVSVELLLRGGVPDRAPLDRWVGVGSCLIIANARCESCDSLRSSLLTLDRELWTLRGDNVNGAAGPVGESDDSEAKDNTSDGGLS